MERVLLVGVAHKGPSAQSADEQMAAHSLEELRRLTETAGGSVVASIAQRMERFNPKSLIGSGKIVEVRKLVETLGAQTVIFDEDLTPAQQIHLEKEIKAKIVDRTRLILDIFAQRARTKEGELQVELAQLSYMLPRLTGSWRAFSQQAGGIGTRGPGERKLEYERRHIQRRLSHLKLGIERMGRDRGVQRRRRSLIPVPSVAIIGYTNAGKSSLLNRLTRISAPERKNASSRVYADDKLFATLDPTTRRIRLPDGGFAVFTDTVGFISKLPTALIAAFRSTLEEVAHADCLLHLEDGASDIISRQRRIVDDVLDSLQAKEIPRVFAVNKSDVLTRDSRISIKAYDDSRVLVSARTGDGVDDLLRQVQTILNDKWLLRKIELDPKDARFLKDIHQNAQVLKQSSHNGKITLLLRVTQENHARLLKKISP